MDSGLEKSVKALKSRIGGVELPEIVIVLGSGFAVFAESLKVEKRIDLKTVEGMKTPKVLGHGSELLIGSTLGKRVAVMTGRIHLYEGHSAMDSVYNLRVLHALGMKKLLLTNASGGLTTKLTPGQIVVIKDHINFTGQNCLVGNHDFIDMSKAYKPEWVEQVAGDNSLESCVYIGVLGPSFETPAETMMFANYADIVGMSTVQEAICGAQLGVEVMALSMVTNLTGGLSVEVEHEEVLKMAKTNNKKIQDVLSSAVSIMTK